MNKGNGSKIAQFVLKKNHLWINGIILFGFITSNLSADVCYDSISTGQKFNVIQAQNKIVIQRKNGICTFRKIKNRVPLYAGKKSFLVVSTPLENRYVINIYDYNGLYITNLVCYK